MHKHVCPSCGYEDDCDLQGLCPLKHIVDITCFPCRKQEWRDLGRVQQT